jgi:hypothetical protein
LSHPRVDHRVPRPRQRATAGGIQLPRLDGRTVSARRYRDLVIAFEAEVGVGSLTESEKSLIRQAAALTLRAEELQSALVLGADIDTDLLVRLSGTAKRILGSIGAKADKNKPDGSADLMSYVASRAAQPADEAEAVDEAVAES